MSNHTSNKRDLTGILLLDKDPGKTSNDALQQVKRLYQARKAGHTGSLDPLASGMLPLCFGEATRFSEFLLDADKYYLVTCKLGVTTTTDDAEGEILNTATVPAFTPNQIEAVLQRFRGAISQIPSMFSALKHHGQPLYKLARQGIEIERQPRTVKIYKLLLLDLQKDTLSFEVICSKGTYIRTLIADIGKQLQCGAHVIALRREGVGNYKADQLIKVAMLQQLATEENFAAMDKLLLPIESIFINWNTMHLTENAIFYLRQGQPIFVPRTPTNGLVALKNKSGMLIGVGEVTADGKIAPRKLLAQPKTK